MLSTPSSSPLYVTAVPGSISRIMLTQSSKSSPSRDATRQWSWFPSCEQYLQFGFHLPENTPHLHYNNHLMPIETVSVHIKPNDAYKHTTRAKCRVIELQSWPRTEIQPSLIVPIIRMKYLAYNACLSGLILCGVREGQWKKSVSHFPNC